MIAALLHGRTHLNFQEFRQQNHLTFFMHVLGVLDRPFIWDYMSTGSRVNPPHQNF